MKNERIKYKNALIFAVIFAMLAFVSVESTSAATVLVPDDYATIQEAVDAANAGDTIIVRDGTYRENIDVKKRLTLKSEKGSENCIVQAAAPDDHVFNVSADHVEISGFSVEGANDYKKAGIGLHADYCNISNNNCSSNRWNGIYLQNSNDNCISNNTCVNSDFGIYIEDSNHNNISNNNCFSNNWEGVHLRNSSDNRISNNNCTNNDDEDLSLYWFSNDNSISNNKCTGGIAIHDSKNNKFKNNVMFENGIFIWGHSRCDYMHEIDENNTVNGKPIYYRKNSEGGRIPDGAGQVILVNCINITVENQNLNYASVGIQIAFSSYSTIKNNTCSSNKWSGINILNSDDNSIACNTCSSNKWEGIYLGKSNNNNISNNTCSNNGRGFSTKYSNTNNGIELYGPKRIPSGKGITIEYSYHNNISNNNCSNNDAGIYLCVSYRNRISNNTCANNCAGIYLLDSNHNKLTGNVMVDNGLYISSYFIWDSVFHTNEIDKNNTVNGKPVYYWKNIEGGRIPAGAGQVILVNCTNICIENQNLNNASIGTQLAFSSFITIKNNTCSNNRDGISLWKSNNNSILNNNCSNNEYAIYLEWSNNNFIYLNNFINNRKGVYYTGSENIWNSTEKITYTYNGSTHSNSLGNYWADYTGNDTNDDEIGETPYRINSDKDNYPLMLPWQNYIPEETRAAENKKKALPKE